MFIMTNLFSDAEDGESFPDVCVEQLSGGVVRVSEGDTPHSFEMQADFEQAMHLVDCASDMFDCMSPALQVYFENSLIVFIEFAVENPDEFNALDLSGDALPVWRKGYH